MTDRSGLLVLTGRAAAGAVGIAKAAIGIDPTDAETLERRRATCEACPSGLYVAGKCDRAGGGCGCWLAMKWRIAAERCPKGHW